MDDGRRWCDALLCAVQCSAVLCCAVLRWLNYGDGDGDGDEDGGGGNGDGDEYGRAESGWIKLSRIESRRGKARQSKTGLGSTKRRRLKLAGPRSCCSDEGRSREWWRARDLWCWSGGG